MSRCRRNKDWTQCSPHFIWLRFTYYMPDDADGIRSDPIAAKQRDMERFRWLLGLTGISQRARKNADFVALLSHNSCRLGSRKTQNTFAIHKRILSSTPMLSFYEGYKNILHALIEDIQKQVLVCYDILTLYRLQYAFVYIYIYIIPVIDIRWTRWVYVDRHKVKIYNIKYKLSHLFHWNVTVVIVHDQKCIHRVWKWYY